MQRLGTWVFQIDPRIPFSKKPEPPTIPIAPHFASREATSFFMEALRSAKLYLEYGAGGSTYLAAEYGRAFVSVESDKRFLHAVQRKITEDGLGDPEHQVYIHADIGRTKKWGYPAIVLPPGRRRRAQFAGYSDFPPVLAASGATPDLILVDGRFRVACALKALRALASKPGWTLIFDDYTRHAYYHVMEQVCPLTRIVGHMGIFQRAGAMDMRKLDRLIHQHEIDAR